MTPGMDPQRGLWNCAINTLVQRSSGDKLLGSDLYQEIRLKAKSSFRSRGGSSRGEFFTNSNVAHACRRRRLKWVPSVRGIVGYPTPGDYIRGLVLYARGLGVELTTLLRK
ncbi:hypothetical protein TNCV_917061 [Trichonephila clavipes]|nr:hypothetical protein TNCV_917061 [Trichonephila clavipes]